MRASISRLVTHLEKLRLVRKETFEHIDELYPTGEVKRGWFNRIESF